MKCPSCHGALKIPQPKHDTAAKPHGPSFAVHCHCGRKFKAPTQLAGRSVKCPGCGKPIRVPKADLPPAGKNHTHPVVSHKTQGLMSLLDEVGATATQQGQNCPQCKTKLPSDAILCVHCGLHLESGKQLRTKRIGRKAR